MVRDFFNFLAGLIAVILLLIAIIGVCFFIGVLCRPIISDLAKPPIYSFAFMATSLFYVGTSIGAIVASIFVILGAILKLATFGECITKWLKERLWKK